MNRFYIVFPVFVVVLWVLFFVAIGQGTTDSFYHIVKPEENVYRISLLYKVPIDSIKKWNKLDEKYSVTVGMKLLIHRKHSVFTEISRLLKGGNGKSTSGVENQNLTVVHIVAEKENVFRISLHYKVAMDSIRAWNQLDQDYKVIEGMKLIIKIPSSKPDGQSLGGEASPDSGLHIVSGEENVFRISLRYHIPVDSIRRWNNLDQNYTVRIGQRLIVSNPALNLPQVKDTTLVQHQDTLKISGDSIPTDSLRKNYPIRFLPTMSETEVSYADSSFNRKVWFYYDKSGYVFRIILFLNMFFLFSATVMAVVILYRRIRSSRIRHIQNSCRDKYREFLAYWLYDDHANSVPESLGTELSEKIHREVFVEELLSLHSNLLGESADILVNLFYFNGLDKYSIQKVMNKKWFVKAKGFRELAQMGISEGVDLIKPYLNSKNSVLRIEAQMAWIQLNPDNPLGFYDEPDIKLTIWGQLNSLVALKKIGNVPDFRRWIPVLNNDVARFSIRLSGLFKQYENADMVAQRLSDDDPETRRTAIITLGKLAVPYPVPALRNLYPIESNSNKIEILIALILIYDLSNISFFEDILLNDSDNYLRILAAKGIKSLDGEGKEKLDSLFSSATDDPLLRNIIIHAKDRRI